MNVDSGNVCYVQTAQNVIRQDRGLALLCAWFCMFSCSVSASLPTLQPLCLPVRVPNSSQSIPNLFSRRYPLSSHPHPLPPVPSFSLPIYVSVPYPYLSLACPPLPSCSLSCPYFMSSSVSQPPPPFVSFNSIAFSLFSHPVSFTSSHSLLSLSIPSLSVPL